MVRMNSTAMRGSLCGGGVIEPPLSTLEAEISPFGDTSNAHPGWPACQAEIKRWNLHTLRRAVGLPNTQIAMVQISVLSGDQVAQHGRARQQYKPTDRCLTATPLITDPDEIEVEIIFCDGGAKPGDCSRIVAVDDGIIDWLKQREGRRIFKSGSNLKVDRNVSVEEQEKMSFHQVNSGAT
jgi:hypothetical protein